MVGIAVFFFPLFNLSVDGYSYNIFMTGVKNVYADVPPSFKINMIFHLSILIALILISIGTLFFYKKRILQMRLCKFGIIVNIIFVFLIYMFADKIKDKFITELLFKPEQVSIRFKTGSILPLIMIVLFLLASRYTSKDEKLVKSADRLR